MAHSFPTSGQPLGRGRIVMTKRGLCTILAEDGERLVLCPIYEAPDLTHRADIPLSWRDELILGLKQNAVVRAIPFLKQRRAVTPQQARLSTLTLTQLRLRTHRELQINALESSRLPFFSGRHTDNHPHHSYAS
ncbi:hypothetical protein NQF86_00410 [Bombella sp. TMW 2.2543]|uniref:Uncharacterized protein n=1 Tax=Bombella pluederhausensis TaxID=2967336 RepID=A0ABT3WDG3_9PROT|nr:hypothetical protein [Bombella pluederhausensis]MCX5617135.1 hypothetical protein [Bombella pluederhausensis]